MTGSMIRPPSAIDFPVDIDLIDRVEVIRGPSSSIYGTNAFLAVINVITRNGREMCDKLNGLEASADGGSFYSYKGRLSYGKQWAEGPEVLVSGSYYDSRGPQLFFREFNTPETRNGIARNCDYESFQSAFSKFTFKDFTLTGVYHNREKGRSHRRLWRRVRRPPYPHHRHQVLPGLEI